MKEFNISYSVFKQIAQNNNFIVYFASDGIKKGTAYAGNDNFVYSARIVSDTWVDFDTTFSVGTRVDVSRHHDAIAQIIGLSSIPPNTVIASTYGYYKEEAHFQGFLVTASGIDVDTVQDYKINSEIYVNGGSYWSDGATAGDYAEFSVVDKDNILGLFNTYGLTEGVDILELNKYVQSIYLNPGGDSGIDLNPPTVANVASGLYMRIKVHTTTTNKVNLGATYLWFEV